MYCHKSLCDEIGIQLMEAIQIHDRGTRPHIEIAAAEPDRASGFSRDFEENRCCRLTGYDRHCNLEAEVGQVIPMQSG
jgi:hypothetical protein